VSFGYRNENDDAVFVRRGPANRFTGVPGADETLRSAAERRYRAWQLLWQQKR